MGTLAPPAPLFHLLSFPLKLKFLQETPLIQAAGLVLSGCIYSGVQPAHGCVEGVICLQIYLHRRVWQ